ncbi:hypothetical protein VFPPC_13550 [Pochonia chlamydosporia 170]|uniref:Rhodopsin domain-containing protein n=1 Tax=Pochonia chlamydosporia 170 TaxID=1380566 RepID=A0A179FQQ6_METCM|nr:hypothetical protein VFPPC_13550 [Pochonia chlamydosporia 170]OAQ67598.1 hypothetical protein VFPPC_13550 [Pochonia chlamydosporia 170]
MDDSFARDFARESWSLYGVGVATIVLRYISRIRRFGIRKLRWDDYIMLNGLIWYTLLCVSLNKIASGGGSNLISDEELAALTPETKEERVIGSKWVFVSEHSMMLAIWSMKACMLILYAGLTDGLKQRQYFNWLGIFIALGFVASELALFLACRPIQQYWAVPAEDPQCYNYAHYEIVQGSFNITGDIAMLLIAIPLIISLHVTIQQKIILLLIFGMGGFVIVASILTKLYCLVPALISYVYMSWYFREASVAVYVTNIPLVWPLVRDVGKCLGVTLASRSNGSRYGTSSHHGQRGRRLDSNSRVRTTDKDLEMNSFHRATKAELAGGVDGRSESQERINGNGNSEQLRDIDERSGMKIKREVTYTVESVSADDLPDGRVWAFSVADPVDAGNRNAGVSTTVMHTARRD